MNSLYGPRRAADTPTTTNPADLSVGDRILIVQDAQVVSVSAEATIVQMSNKATGALYWDDLADVYVLSGDLS